MQASSSGVRIVVGGLVLVGFAGLVAVGIRNSGVPRGEVGASPSEQADLKPAPNVDPPSIRSGRILIGGVERDASDVNLQDTSNQSQRRSPKKRQGYSPGLSPEANEQVALVADSLRSGTNPERFSSFRVPHNFDAGAFAADPPGYSQSFAAIVEPGRVFAPAQPGEGVEVLRPGSKRFHRLKQGETVRLAVEAVPFAPVTFSSQNLGQFENQLTSFTAVAGDDGVAQASFTASGGTIDEVKILAASPVTSGQVAFVVSVEVAP